MERLAHEQAQVDEYIQQRQLDTVKPFSFPRPWQPSAVMRCARHKNAWTCDEPCYS